MSGSVHTESSDSTSRSLLRRAREHDPAAWEKLTAVYSPVVYQWCRRARLQTTDATDVVQEVFRSVATGLRGFRKERPEDTFRGWLWAITRNKIRDHFRARDRQPDARGGTAAHVQLEQLPEKPPPEPDEALGEHLHSKLARRAVSVMQTDFEEATWRAFWLTAVEKQSTQTVAEKLDMSTAAVYKAKSRVLRRLREELDGLDLID